jgi:hypothetical protein
MRAFGRVTTNMEGKMLRISPNTLILRESSPAKRRMRGREETD